MTHGPRPPSCLAAFGLLIVACASGPRARPAADARINDSAPEKVAAQQSAAPGLHVEEEDQRWGFEAARARRREAEQKKQAAAPSKTPPASGPVDLSKQPASAPQP